MHDNRITSRSLSFFAITSRFLSDCGRVENIGPGIGAVGGWCEREQVVFVYEVSLRSTVDECRYLDVVRDDGYTGQEISICLY